MKQSEFASVAHPISWLQVADDLHVQACKLHGSFGDEIVHVTSPKGGPNYSASAANRSTFLLAGFAIENALKAFLVYENPTWVAGGRLSNKLRTHELQKLQHMSSLVPFRSRMAWVLRDFEVGLESWARYPCGLNSNDAAPPSVLSDRLWDGYRKVMRAYGSKLTNLLEKGWQSPHEEGPSLLNHVGTPLLS